MKNLLFILAGIMMMCLLFGTYLYYDQTSITFPSQHQPNEAQENITPDEPNQTETKSIQPVDNEKISYSLQNEELQITYSGGDNWREVPVEIDALFSGEYNGNKQELIEDSYVLEEEYVAFLYTEDEGSDVQSIQLKYSEDQGETWKDSVIVDTFSHMRFRKVEFLNDSFGYVIISGGRTMSQEYSTAFLTHDGGETWEATSEPPTSRLIGFGGFVNETTGFLSYGTINPEEPDVYVTQDGGVNWSQADFRMPEKYEEVFVQAEMPSLEKDHLEVLVNQGPNGDYAGGLVKGKFISEDNGKTWDFSEEVDSDETKQE